MEVHQNGAATAPRWSARRVIAATLVVVGVILAFWLAVRFRLVLFSLFEAIVFSTAIRPSVEWMRRRGIPRPVGITLDFLVILGLIVGFFYLTAPMIISQISTISKSLSDFYQVFYNSLLRSTNLLIYQLAIRLPASILTVPALPAEKGNPLSTVAQGLAYLNIIGNSLFATIAVLLLTFYWTLDRDKSIYSLLRLVSDEKRKPLTRIIEATEARVGAYVRGVVILCTSIGVMAFVAYLIIGLPHALVLGLMAAVFEVVPLIGPFLGAVPPIVIALSIAPQKVIWVILAVWLIQSAEGHLLVPKVMNKTVGVHPVVSLLAFAAFSSLFGFAGALLAVPMAALIQILVDRFVLSPDAISVPPEPVGRDRVSTLRYATQELIQDIHQQVRSKDDDVTDETDIVEDSIEAIATDLDSILARYEEDGQGEKKEKEESRL